MKNIKLIKFIKKLDINSEENEDWPYDLLNKIPGQYSKGYLTAKIENLGESLSCSSEDYREEIIEIVGFLNINE